MANRQRERCWPSSAVRNSQIKDSTTRRAKTRNPERSGRMTRGGAQEQHKAQRLRAQRRHPQPRTGPSWSPSSSLSMCIPYSNSSDSSSDSSGDSHLLQPEGRVPQLWLVCTSCAQTGHPAWRPGSGPGSCGHRPHMVPAHGGVDASVAAALYGRQLLATFQVCEDCHLGHKWAVGSVLSWGDRKALLSFLILL